MFHFKNTAILKVYCRNEIVFITIRLTRRLQQWNEIHCMTFCISDNTSDTTLAPRSWDYWDHTCEHRYVLLLTFPSPYFCSIVQVLCLCSVVIQELSWCHSLLYLLRLWGREGFASLLSVAFATDPSVTQTDKNTTCLLMSFKVILFSPMLLWDIFDQLKWKKESLTKSWLKLQTARK